MKVLYLYTEVMGYNLPIFERLVTHYDAAVDVVHWNQNKLTPFVPDPASGVKYHERSSFTPQGLLDFALALSPDVVYVSGWMDKGYLPVIEKLKALGTPIVVGLDTQWTGSLRQQLGSRLIKWIYKKRYFSYALVPGPMQYEYAARIGFGKTEILCHLLSGNTGLFKRAAQSLQHDKQVSYPKNFLYVGRFAQTKGIDILLQAFELYRNQYRGDWTLTCIGNGPMANLLESAQQKYPEAITLKAFSSQAALVDQARNAGAFVLPSREDPWGVVVHEFATAGLPLILSEFVGARPQFLIDGLNGFTFHQNSPEQLALQMHKIATSTTEQLLEMGRVSAHLGAYLNPEISAASLMAAQNRAGLNG